MSDSWSGKSEPPERPKRYDQFFLYHHLEKDGYGYAGIKLRKEFARLGAGIEPVDMLVDGRHSRRGEYKWTASGPALALCVPDWWPDITAEPLIGFTMFESTRLPSGRIADMQGAERILVPCPWCVETFREEGVQQPIDVVPWGIDPDDYFPLDRDDTRGPYTFLWSGTPDYRKGWDLAYRAFSAAFGERDDAHLILHFRELPQLGLQCNDEKVTIVEGRFSLPRLRAMLRDADCFVFPSRGEGWGMPPREAAATGLPAIATDWSGLSYEIEHWALPLRITGMAAATFGPWPPGAVGQWATPDLEHLVHLMRWCYDHRDLAAKIGQDAAQWLATNTTWARTAQGIMEALEC